MGARSFEGVCEVGVGKLFRGDFALGIGGRAEVGGSASGREGTGSPVGAGCDMIAAGRKPLPLARFTTRSTATASVTRADSGSTDYVIETWLAASSGEVCGPGPAPQEWIVFSFFYENFAVTKIKKLQNALLLGPLKGMFLF